EPLRNAVTSPVLDTLPTAGSLLAQLIARPRTALPETSHIAAVSCTVPRTTTSTDSGMIATAAIVAGGAEASLHASTASAARTAGNAQMLGGLRVITASEIVPCCSPPSWFRTSRARGDAPRGTGLRGREEDLVRCVRIAAVLLRRDTESVHVAGEELDRHMCGVCGKVGRGVLVPEDTPPQYVAVFDRGVV